MKAGLGGCSVAVTAGGIVAWIGARSPWWTVITKGAPVPGMGNLSFPGTKLTQSGSAQFPLLSVSAAAIVVIGLASWMIAPRMRTLLALVAIAGSLHVLAASGFAFLIHETLGTVHQAPRSAGVFVAAAGAFASFIGSVLLVWKFRTVRRPSLPAGTPQSFDEPDRGVWE